MAFSKKYIISTKIFKNFPQNQVQQYVITHQDVFNFFRFRVVLQPLPKYIFNNYKKKTSRIGYSIHNSYGIEENIQYIS